ncbi:SDR family NAD(P)-dependent oxidoreductase [Pseudonocardia sp. TRM90224]|uniref:SDR family NAD(P)-dependent oxidoreductase n=1 Tax=Pseudonocardia sp. TRM90224 TaxID=2812678 RepID=UPI001E47DA96|nr:SDR family NAD(P)-dependent oxidoreductase [Pseudonocardia sp. TRM90224]
MTSKPRRWLITGAAAGLGRALAEAVIAQGDEVVATSRSTGPLADLGAAQVLQMDVTNAAQVRACVADAVAGGGIDVLVNNAGHGLVGALEELSDAELQAVIGTNVIGALAVTRAVLPHMRSRRSGHIVQMSSVGGVVGNPGHAAYALTKFALEGFSEALAGEVAPFGIRVTIVEPGPFRTAFAGRSMRFSTAIPDYADGPAGTLRARMRDQDGVQPGDPALAAEAIITTVRAESAPLRLPLGEQAVNRIRMKLERQLADLAETAALSLSTSFAST